MTSDALVLRHVKYFESRGGCCPLTFRLRGNGSTGRKRERLAYAEVTGREKLFSTNVLLSNFHGVHRCEFVVIVSVLAIKLGLERPAAIVIASGHAGAYADLATPHGRAGIPEDWGVGFNERNVYGESGCC